MPFKVQPGFTCPVEVTSSHVDAFNHVNNLQYLQWMVEIAETHSTHLGWDLERYQKTGAAFFVLRHEIDYLIPAVKGDELVIGTWCGEMDRIRGARYYEIMRSKDSKIVARGKTTWVFVDLETGKPKKIPDEIRKTFSPNEEAVKYFNPH